MLRKSVSASSASSSAVAKKKSRPILYTCSHDLRDLIADSLPVLGRAAPALDSLSRRRAPLGGASEPPPRRNHATNMMIIMTLVTSLPTPAGRNVANPF